MSKVDSHKHDQSHPNHFSQPYQIKGHPIFGNPEILPQIYLDKHILKHYTHFALIEKVSQTIKIEIPNYELLKLNPELTKLICTVVENNIPGKLKKILDKRTIIVEIYIKIFGDISDDDIEALLAQVDFLYDNSLIKKIGTLSKMYRYFKKNLAESVF